MKRWYYKFRGDPYAYGPFEASSLRKAKDKIREVWRLIRLPPGTEIWMAEQ